MSQYIDISSVREHFPIGINVPEQLLELLEWLNSNIDDEVGWFPEFNGTELDWYCRPADISPYFGTFTCLGDGSILAYWFYEGCDIEKAPIVVLGSEGDCGIVAASCEEFVARLLRGSFHPPDATWVSCIGNFYLYPDYSWLEKLEDWAQKHWGLTLQRMEELRSSPPKKNYPDIQEWIDAISS